MKVTISGVSHHDSKIHYFCADQGIKVVALYVAPGEWGDTLSLACGYGKQVYLALETENSVLSQVLSLVHAVI